MMGQRDKDMTSELRGWAVGNIEEFSKKVTSVEIKEDNGPKRYSLALSLRRIRIKVLNIKLSSNFSMELLENRE